MMKMSKRQKQYAIGATALGVGYYLMSRPASAEPATPAWQDPRVDLSIQNRIKEKVSSMGHIISREKTPKRGVKPAKKMISESPRRSTSSLPISNRGPMRKSRGPAKKGRPQRKPMPKKRPKGMMRPPTMRKRTKRPTTANKPMRRRKPRPQPESMEVVKKAHQRKLMQRMKDTNFSATPPSVRNRLGHSMAGSGSYSGSIEPNFSVGYAEMQQMDAVRNADLLGYSGMDAGTEGDWFLA